MYTTIFIIQRWFWQFGYDDILVCAKFWWCKRKWWVVLYEVVKGFYFVKKYDSTDEVRIVGTDELAWSLLSETVEDILWWVTKGKVKK